MSETSLEELKHDRQKKLQVAITDVIVEDLQEIRIRLVNLFLESGNEKYRDAANILLDCSLRLT